jgi:signal transduction histidine kinase
MTIDRVNALNDTAWEIGLREPARARESAIEALELSRRIGYRRGEALAVRTLGYWHLLAGEFEPAHRLTRDALTKLRAVRDKSGEASALNSLGILYARLGDFDKALESGLECLRLYRQASDRRGEAWAHAEIGNVHLAVGELALARSELDEARAIFEELDYAPGLGNVWNLLGNVARSMNDPECALECYEKSLALATSSGMPMGISGTAASIGRIHQASGDRRKARRYFQLAIEASKDNTLRTVNAYVLLSLGLLELEERNYERARDLFEQGVRVTHGAFARDTESELHEAMSRVYEAQGQLEKALEHYKEFHRLKDALFDEDARVRLKNLQLRLGVEKAEKEAESERVRYEQLAGMQAQLVQSEKMALLGQLVAGLSHEINTPVGVINANAALSARALDVIRNHCLDVDGNSRLRSAVEALSSSQRSSAAAGERLAELLKSLKLYARLDESELQRVDISTCVEATLRLFETQLPDSIRLDKSLEPIPEMTCRPGQINQALMTVLVNARQAIDSEGTIAVRSFPRHDFAFIEITDTGRGIAGDKIPSLFDIDFAHRDSQVRLRMGLSTAKTIIEKHGGSVDVDSTVGEGTTFRMRLPLKPVVAPFFGGGVPWARSV